MMKKLLALLFIAFSAFGADDYEITTETKDNGYLLVARAVTDKYILQCKKQVYSIGPVDIGYRAKCFLATLPGKDIVKEERNSEANKLFRNIRMIDRAQRDGNAEQCKQLKSQSHEEIEKLYRAALFQGVKRVSEREDL